MYVIERHLRVPVLYINLMILHVFVVTVVAVVVIQSRL